MEFTVILSPEPDAYCASVPAMPGAASWGSTRDEALSNIAEAMEGWIEVGRERDSRPIPETPELIAKMLRDVLEDRAEEGLDSVVETARVSVRVPVLA